MEIEVIEYDPRWVERFEAERAVLTEALGPWFEGGIHHIGSTSVPGLAAKPVIDMMAGVTNLAEAMGAIEALEALGYTHGERRPRTLWFSKRSEPDWRTGSFNLHLTESGSDLWVERLGFRTDRLAPRWLRVTPLATEIGKSWRCRREGGWGDGVSGSRVRRGHSGAAGAVAGAARSHRCSDPG